MVIEGDAAVKRPRLSEALASLWKTRWGNAWGYVFILPAALVYLVFNLWPIFRGVTMAFQDYRWLVPATRGLWDFNGIQNYLKLFDDPMFWRSFGISLKFSAMKLPIEVGLALFVAVMISKVRNVFMSNLYRVIAYLPVVVPVSAAMLVWRHIYNTQYGYLNYMLSVVGVANPPNWLGDPKWALFAVALASAWRSFGFSTLIFLVGLYNINTELYESASLDGANAWQSLWFLTLPLLRPMFSLVLVLSAQIVGAVEEMLILFAYAWTPETGPGGSCLTTGYYAYRVAFQLGEMRMGYAASMSLIVGVVNMIIAFTIFRWFRTERA